MSDEIVRWADLVLPHEIPHTDKARHEFMLLHMRIAELEQDIYGLPYKPIPKMLSNWLPRDEALRQ